MRLMNRLNYPWTEASLSDANAFDFNVGDPELLANEASAHRLGDLFIAEDRSTDEQSNSSRSRVLRMVASALQLHQRLDLPKTPYSAMMEFGDRRTAIGSDWKGCGAVLDELGRRSPNPVICARLLDLAWLVERSRVDAGRAAVLAYVRVADGMLTRELRHRDYDSDHRPISEVKSTLRRGLQICELLRLREDDSNFMALRTFCLASADQFESEGDSQGLLAMMNLALDYELDLPERCAPRMEVAARGFSSGTDPHSVCDALVGAGRAWRRAQDTANYEKCMLEASCRMAEHGRALGGNLSGSHFVQQAIDLLRGLSSPDAKASKRELRIELIRLQSAAEDEFGTFEYSFDLSELVKAVKDRTQGLSIEEALFLLAAIHRPRPTSVIEEEAMEGMRKHPLGSLFGVQQHDSDGHVRFRSPGTDMRKIDPAALEHAIARQEGIYRETVVRGQIAVVVYQLASEHSVTLDEVFPLCRESPFVPPDLTETFSKGILAFLHGDMTSAMFILTPLLEASLVYVLKGHDVDVVRHDEDSGTQEDMSITQLYKNHRGELEAIFSASVVDDIERVFLARSGPGLRHAIAHGTTSDGQAYSGDSIYACWLMWHLCLVPLFKERFEARGRGSEADATD
ncbi:hypothetical protein [Stenotrophomonas sp. HMWF003]|uniref:DUF7380 domain-containing protein n=1 Tax=Stenotrophomonas sp. HMWF003 TaxID=2056840 RepID=UPI001C63561A|nr:hypothetical protein [Stenotrophomonas sp. HMWF003]